MNQSVKEGFDDFADWLEPREHFIVASHVDPDGDAVGSTIALGLWLEDRGNDVVMYNRDPAPHNCRFLQGADRLTGDLEGVECDGVILLDVSERQRIGDQFRTELFESGVAIVDHHDTWDEGAADVWLRDPSAASVGEILFRFFRRENAEITDDTDDREVEASAQIDLPIAEALYTTLMTDTGSFQYSNTSKTTFQAAGALLEAGVEPWKMTRQLYENQPRGRIELLKDVLQTLHFTADGRLAFIRIEQEMFDRTGTTPAMADGFINYGRSVRGVEVSTKLLELEGDQKWKVSFRSVGRVDVSEIATQFGGGGHVNAAGCQMEGTPDDIERRLTDALYAVIEEE